MKMVALVAATAGAAGPNCDQVAANRVTNCGFARDLRGWRPQAVTTLAFDPKHGSPAPGALRMTNQPASEAGAATCVAVPASAVARGAAAAKAAAPAYELRGLLQRLDGPGECLAFLEEHTTADCSAGATAFHTLATERLVEGTFTEVRGSSAVSPSTVALRAGFACYGEQDDDVQSVLLDDVVLRRVEAGAR